MTSVPGVTIPGDGVYAPLGTFTWAPMGPTGSSGEYPWGATGATGGLPSMPMSGFGATGPMDYSLPVAPPSLWDRAAGTTGSMGPLPSSFPVVSADGTITIDLHEQRGALTRLAGMLAKPPESGSINLDLSSTSLTDGDVERLTALLERTNLISRIQQLDISHNQIRRDGLLACWKFLEQPEFQYLNVCNNPFSEEDGVMSSLVGLMDIDAERLVPTLGKDKKDILGDWMAKIIHVSAGYDYDGMAMGPKMRAAHKKYYKVGE